MHLVSYGPKAGLKTFYPKHQALARPDSLPHLFRKLRQNRNLTKKSLAFRFGISEDYVSAIESGSKPPSLKFCLQCARKFEINPNYIKVRWFEETVKRFSDRLKKRLGLLD